MSVAQGVSLIRLSELVKSRSAATRRRESASPRAIAGGRYRTVFYDRFRFSADSARGRGLCEKCRGISLEVKPGAG
jgi:hypothetical protein